MTDRQAGERPLLRVIRGEPTPAELAALVAVLAGRGRAVLAGRGRAVPTTEGTAHPGPRGKAGGWADRTTALRRPLAPGPGAWRAAGRLAGTRTGAGR